MAVVVVKGTLIHTDDWKPYRTATQGVGPHEWVQHSYGEYSRKSWFPGRPKVTTNTVEGFFSRLKRGLNGTFHAVSRAHLHRYVTEFQYRYNTRKLNDGDRVSDLIRSTQGKRLMYRESRARSA